MRQYSAVGLEWDSSGLKRGGTGMSWVVLGLEWSFSVGCNRDGIFLSE